MFKDLTREIILSLTDAISLESKLNKINNEEEEEEKACPHFPMPVAIHQSDEERQIPVTTQSYSST